MVDLRVRLGGGLTASWLRTMGYATWHAVEAQRPPEPGGVEASGQPDRTCSAAVALFHSLTTNGGRNPGPAKPQRRGEPDPSTLGPLAQVLDVEQVLVPRRRELVRQQVLETDHRDRPAVDLARGSMLEGSWRIQKSMSPVAHGSAAHQQVLNAEGVETRHKVAKVAVQKRRGHGISGPRPEG